MIQKAAMQGGKISDNPIFTGALGVYNGVILHEAYRLPRTTTTGGSVASTNVLCGAQACHMAFGRDHGPNRFHWVEELFDFQNKLAVAAGAIAGLKKTIYNSADYGVVTVYSGNSATSETVNGR